MDFEYLSEFVDLANTLSFTKSAERLNISQPTLSRHIAHLEKQLGTRLVKRSTSSVLLTRAGKTFYERAVAITNSCDEIVDELRNISEDGFVEVVVGGSTIQPTINRLFTKLASRCAAEGLSVRPVYDQTRDFSGKAPFVSMELLRSGKFDYVVDLLPPTSPHLQEFRAVELCTEPLLVFASADNPHAGEANLQLEDLFDCTLNALSIFPLCPALFMHPFVAAGYGFARVKTSFIGNLLEIPETLATMEPNEIIPLQKELTSSFGFGQDGTGQTVVLDVRDERCRVSFWELTRKDDDSAGVTELRRLMARILDEYRQAARPDDFDGRGMLRSSVLYSGPSVC